MMKRLAAVFLPVFLGASPALALETWPTTDGGGQVVNGQLNMILNGSGKAAPVSSGNPIPVSGTFSASLGGFVPSGSYSTLTATAASSASTALPTNTGTVAFQNQNATAVSCNLSAGAATATANQLIVPAGSTVFVGTTGLSNAACIDQTGSASNVIIMAGGSGLGTGFGGGSSGGGGSNASVSATGSAVPGSATYMGILSGGNLVGWNGSVSVASGSQVQVFGPTAVGSAAANPPVLQGGTANGAATGNVQVQKVDATGQQFFDCGSSSNTLCGLIGGATPAGTNIIGKIGIDQTTPGTTNGVQVNAALPAGTNAIGDVGTAMRPAKLTSAVVNISTSGDNIVVTRAVGTIKVYRMGFACASAVTVTIKNGTSTALSGAMPGITSWYSPMEGGEPQYTTTGTNNFVVNLGSAVSCQGTVWYIDS